MPSLDELLDISDDDIKQSVLRKKRKKRTALATGLVTGLAATAGFDYHFVGEALQQGRPFFDSSLMPYHGVSSLMGFLAGLFFNTGYVTFGDYLSKQGVTTALKGLKVEMNQLRGKVNPKVAGEFRTEAARLKDEPLDKVRASAATDIAQGRREWGLRKLARLARAYRTTNFKPSLTERLIIGLEEAMIKYLPSVKARTGVNERIEWGFKRLHQGSLGNAEAHMRSSLSSSGIQGVESHCLYAYFLEAMGVGEERTKLQWGKTLDLVFDIFPERTGFERIAGTANKVFRVSNRGLLADTFIIKQSNTPSYLQQEYEITRQARREVFPDTETVAEPLAFLSREGEPFLVLRYVTGSSLTKKQSQETIIKAIEAAQEFHERLNAVGVREQWTGVLPFLDYAVCMREKFAERVAPDKVDEVATKTKFVTDFLAEQQYQVIHRDMHPDNLRVRANNRVTFLDLEHMSFGTREVDAVGMVESHLLDLSEGAQALFYRRWHDTLSEDIGFDEFSLRLRMSGVFRHLWTLGAIKSPAYGFSKAEYRERRQWYEERALDNLAQIILLDPSQRENAKRLEEVIVAA